MVYPRLETVISPNTDVKESGREFRSGILVSMQCSAVDSPHVRRRWSSAFWKRQD